MNKRIDRLDLYMNYKGYTDRKVNEDCGLSNGLIGKARKESKQIDRNVDLGLKAAKKIVEVYTDLNPNWLLFGEGQMLNKNIPDEYDLSDNTTSEIAIEEIKEKVERLNKAMRYLISSELISGKAPQKDIADKMGANKSSVTHAYNGDVRYLTNKFFRRFNNAFDSIFNEDWLLTGEGEMLKNHPKKENSQLSDGDSPDKMPVNANYLAVVERLRANGIITSLTDFALKLGLNSAQPLYDIQKGRYDVSKDIAEKMMKSFNVNPNFILFGLGEMFLKMEASPISTNVFQIPLVGKYAYAGFLNGYGDDEYMDTLPTVPFIIPEGGNLHGEYIAIEVKGDSMNDGSIDSLQEGDVLLCRFISPDLYRFTKLHMNKWNFVIVTLDGVVVKRIIDHNLERGTITVHSLNPFHKDYEIDLREVQRIYNVVQYQRKPNI